MKTSTKRTIRAVVIVVGFSLVGTSIIACGPTPPKPIGLDAPKETVVVELAQVTKRDFKSDLIISGVISSETEARLSFKTGGIIESMTVRDGDTVPARTVTGNAQPD